MGKKILIIGGVAGGASVAARARRLDEFAEIIMFEKGPHVSFSNCSLPFYLSGMVKESEDLVLMDPETFLSQYNIQARVNHEVTKINRENKRVSVKNLLTGKEYEEDYDELVISTGANPIIPNIEGAQDSHVFIVRNVVDIEKLGQFLKNPGIRDVAVIGGGFIGVEVVGNLVKAGYNVTLVEAMDQIMAPFDYDMAQILHREMMDNGVNLILSDGVRMI
ncbi:MAG: FAD-dependent oxidoreductase, partial [Firmicutes bacterium]|nr:FAD-dependent oxidoreductase [Bacillota bacterium]